MSKDDTKKTDDKPKVPDPAKVEKFVKSEDRYQVKKTDEKA